MNSQSNSVAGALLHLSDAMSKVFIAFDLLEVRLRRPRLEKRQVGAALGGRRRR